MSELLIYISLLCLTGVVFCLYKAVTNLLNVTRCQSAIIDLQDLRLRLLESKSDTTLDDDQP